MIKKVPQHTILEASAADIKGDFEELDYLYSTMILQLRAFTKQLQQSEKYIYTDTVHFVKRQTENYLHNYTTAHDKIRVLLDNLKTTTATKTNIELLTQQKHHYYQILRAQQGLVGSLITATDWQSPSFLHSTFSMAGRQTGKIIGMVNDYKRDRHLDEQEYEKRFVKEYIDGIFKLGVHAFLTNSGMAAFTTILNFLQMEKAITGLPVLIGKSIYFENKELIQKLIRTKIITIDEMRTDHVLDVITKQKPSAIFLDSLCNATDIAVPDLKRIIRTVVKVAQKDTIIVIDNTGLSIALQPLKFIIGKTHKVQLITFESLNKYHQFGMDRVTGGIIWAYGKDTAKLFFAREHSGTNIGDSPCYILPVPSRRYLQSRLDRHNRNATYLAANLHDYALKNPRSKIASVIYPGLPHHESYAWSKGLSFQGSYFVLQFKPKHQTVRNYRRFLKMVIAEAKKQNVQIVAGTSFGFNTTRVYLTSLQSDYGTPFVRVSVGTENRLELEQIREVFINVLERV